MSGWDEYDLTLPEVSLPPAADRRRSLSLTVLYHPDASRVGQVAPLPYPGGSLSRLQPLFSDPRCPRGEAALDDPFLSRTPVEITVRGSGLTVVAASSGASLRIQGQAVASRVELPTAALDAGVVLGLSNRVVLLLHWRPEEPVVEDDCCLVGEADAVQVIRRLLARVAERDVPVLLLGESGTGKELVASSLHARSRRRSKPLVTVNMAAIPPDLAAAELFGVRRGAYTGADSDRLGYFREADGGTLFLDEVGACGAGVQAQLLRALQQGEVQSPGGGSYRVDVRILAATDADPRLSFSTALRHRLGGFELRLPPLRERRSDIGRLLVHFLPARLFDGVADKPREVSRFADLVTRMALYDWPGNVRELANVCRQVDIASVGGLSLPAGISLEPKPVGAATRYQPGSRPSDDDIRNAMLAARWEISRAARDLQISRQALYRRLESIPELRSTADIPGPEVESAWHECKGDVEQAALRLQVSAAALRRRWRAMDLPPEGW